MVRTVFLIRHAMPDIPLGERWCIGGRSDLPLGRLGRVQAARLPFMPELRTVSAVFCSPLIRAVETARPLCAEPRIRRGLEEQDMGVWDGLPFREIMLRWPSLYQARQINEQLMPEGAEAPDAVALRMRAAVLRCLEQSEGDIAIVSHKSAIASLTGDRRALGYASLSVLTLEGGELHADGIGIRPAPEPDDTLCLAMLKAAGADDKLIAHCRAVAAAADEMCSELFKTGLSPDAAAVHRAALLHDIAKDESDHAAVGCAWLRELGYPDLADIVRQHTEPDSDTLNEAGLVFLADKLVRGAEPVSLDERFAASLPKCRTPEAKDAHARRYAAARSIKSQFDRLTGSSRP